MTTPEPGLTVCVFCSASDRVSDRYRAIASELGSRIGERGWRLVYGGGSLGLMGEVARGALSRGGRVMGVIPHRLAEIEVMLPDVLDLVRTDSMRQRKEIMDGASDVFVVLPGGIGTLEELVEILTLKQLGFHERPVVILDADGYWDGLLAQIDKMVALEMAPPKTLSLFDAVTDVDDAMALLVACEGATNAREARAAGAGRR